MQLIDLVQSWFCRDVVLNCIDLYEPIIDSFSLVLVRRALIAWVTFTRAKTRKELWVSRAIVKKRVLKSLP